MNVLFVTLTDSRFFVTRCALVQGLHLLLQVSIHCCARHVSRSPSSSLRTASWCQIQTVSEPRQFANSGIRELNQRNNRAYKRQSEDHLGVENGGFFWCFQLRLNGETSLQEFLPEQGPAQDDRGEVGESVTGSQRRRVTSVVDSDFCVLTLAVLQQNLLTSLSCTSRRTKMWFVMNDLQLQNCWAS